MGREISRNRRRRLIRLVYMLCAKESPECRIQRDPLRKMYPDVNYGVLVSLPNGQAQELSAKVENAFNRRGYKVWTRVYKNTLEISSFYLQ